MKAVEYTNEEMYRARTIRLQASVLASSQHMDIFITLEVLETPQVRNLYVGVLAEACLVTHSVSVLFFL